MRFLRLDEEAEYHERKAGTVTVTLNGSALVRYVSEVANMAHGRVPSGKTKTAGWLQVSS
ncbi:hypothetical protein CWS43_26060 [Rahnella sp. AA]|nr:hypothetical protein CWS43_26060 [Rahnella sp. AA]